MQQKQPPDYTENPLAPQLIAELESALQKLQQEVAAHSSPDHLFALVHLVEGVPLDAWKQIAAQLHSQRWLALPLDKKDGVLLQRLRIIIEELRHQRDHDLLTGLANRRLFEHQLSLEIQRASRTDTPISLVMLDIDNFKDVNDTYGHPTGDKVLAALGDLLARSRRIYDVAARVGGEEFCLLLPGASTRQAADMANRVREGFFEIPFETPDGSIFHCTFSAGVATAHGGTSAASGPDLFAQADALMYKAKGKGKNCVVTVASKYRVSGNSALVQTAEKHFLFTGKDTQ